MQAWAQEAVAVDLHLHSIVQSCGECEREDMGFGS